MKNWQTMLLALGMAMFTWFLVTGREVVETWIDMPLVITNPPEGIIIEDGLVDKIQVRLRGPKGLVGNLTSQNLSYSLDLGKLHVGQQVVDVESSKLGLPSTFEIIEIKPNRMTLQVDRRVSKKIALTPAWSGKLNKYYKLLEVVAAPDLVEIRGPETVLRKISKANVVLKEDFPDEVPRNWVENVGIELPEEVEASPGQVRVEAFFGPKTREIWVKLPLDVVAPEGFKVSVPQDFVRILIEGPIKLFKNNEYRKEMAASLVFGDKAEAGQFELDYMIGLPDGCRLLKKNPESVKTTLKKK